MTHSERAERPRELEPFGSGGLGVPRPQALARGVNSELSARFRVDEPERAHAGQRLLARIADLDGDHVMTACQPEQWSAPVPRPAEVRDDGDERPLACDGARTPKRLSERRGAARRLVLLAVEGEQEPDERRPPLTGRSVAGSSPPNVSTPRRFP